MNELAVRKFGNENVALVSAQGELILQVDRWGWITVLLKGSDRESVRLVRDGEGDPLTAPTPTVADASVMASIESAVASRCGARVTFEVGPVSSDAARRGTFHAVHRTGRALSEVCRDASGKSAVARKLATVRIRPGVDGGSAAALRLEGRVLSIDATFDDEAFGPFADEIQRFIERHL